MPLITLTLGSPSIQCLCKKDKRLAKVIATVGPISYEPRMNSYVSLVHSIIEQMLSIAVGDRIFRRLESLCEGSVSPRTVSALTDEQIRGTGMSMPKVGYIRSLTEAVATGKLDFNELPSLSDDEVMKRLTAIKGIGPWTAKMYLIFMLDRQDVLPYEDLTFLAGYKWLYKTEDVSATAVKKKCAKWKPYSSIAARYLYRAFDAGMTKSEFHLFK